MGSDPSEFDLEAAWLRRAQGDLRAFMEGLAVRLEAALPGRVEVERRRDGLFSTHSHVARIGVTLGTRRLGLELHRGALQARTSRVVHGVVLGSDDIPVPVWLETLIHETRAASQAAGEAHGLLNDFLLS